MTKRDDQSSRLLADTLHDDWTTGRPAEFARLAAARARRHQRGKKLTAAAGSLAVIALALFVSLRKPAAVESRESAPRVATALTAPIPARGYEIISDAELLAEVRDRSLLAVAREDGRREIVVLPNE